MSNRRCCVFAFVYAKMCKNSANQHRFATWGATEREQFLAHFCCARTSGGGGDDRNGRCDFDMEHLWLTQNALTTTATDGRTDDDTDDTSKRASPVAPLSDGRRLLYTRRSGCFALALWSRDSPCWVSSCVWILASRAMSRMSRLCWCCSIFRLLCAVCYAIFTVRPCERMKNGVVAVRSARRSALV